MVASVWDFLKINEEPHRDMYLNNFCIKMFPLHCEADSKLLQRRRNKLCGNGAGRGWDGGGRLQNVIYS